MSHPLTHWRWIIVNSSAGKDSQTALRVIVDRCDQAGVDRSRIVVSHQCLGRMEWEGTLELVRQQAAVYGLRVEVSRYRDKTGAEIDLLEYVRRRGMWPSSQQRYCTSEFKRGPGGRVITKLFRESPGPILNVYGFRSEESPARAKKSPSAKNERFSTDAREVWDDLPIHGMSEEEVWASIRESGVPSHPAYALGMPRLSCRFCIFATRAALITAGRANPELLDEYCAGARRRKASSSGFLDNVIFGWTPTCMGARWRRSFTGLFRILLFDGGLAACGEPPVPLLIAPAT